MTGVARLVSRIVVLVAVLMLAAVSPAPRVSEPWSPTGTCGCWTPPATWCG